MIIDPSDVDHGAFFRIATGKHQFDFLFILWSQLGAELGQNFSKGGQKYLTLIVFCGSLFQLGNHLRPLLSNFVEAFCEYFDSLILMHFLMDNAEVLLAQRGLPALRVSAVLDLDDLLFVLSEVETLCREHFRTDGHLKVFVRYFAIAIQVKFVEDFLKFILGDLHAPEVEVVFELLLGYLARLFHIEILESLPEGLPLEFDLLEDLVFDVSIHESILGGLDVASLVFSLKFDEPVQTWVLDGVVPEVEALALLDLVAQPLREVLVVELALTLLVTVHDQFIQVVVI